jgi:hypothetical protein
VAKVRFDFFNSTVCVVTALFLILGQRSIFQVGAEPKRICNKTELDDWEQVAEPASHVL